MTILPLVVGYFAIQWNRAGYLGKSPEQIVAMGREKWSDLYQKKFGTSTVSMSDAQEKYGIALQNLNDRAMTQLPRPRQNWLKDVRKTTIEYAQDAHGMGRILSGGGTIWQNYDSTILPDVEQAISDCILKKPIQNSHAKSFKAEFQEVDRVVADRRKEIEPSEAKELDKHRSDLGVHQSQLMSLLAKGPAQDASRIQKYMHRKIAVASGDES